MKQNSTILIFIDWYLPGFNAGGPVRSMANMIDHLNSEFNFKIITRNNDYQDQTPYKHITPGEWIRLNKNTECCYLSPDQVKYSYIKKFIKTIPVDITYINGIYSFYFSILPLFFIKRFTLSKIIVAPRGMLAESAIGVKKSKKSLFLQIAKLLRLYNKVTFHATNEKEATQISSLISKKAVIHIAPNFPKKSNNNLSSKKINTAQKLRLLAIARIAPEKNTLYAIKTLMHQYQGEIFFNLYGSIYNRQYWEECQKEIEDMPQNITVTKYPGILPEKVESAFQGSDFLFIPTQGENFGHTILESLSAGCPVIISDQTPWRNLQNTDFGPVGWDIPLSTPQKFIEIIQYCINMPQEEYTKMSRAAYLYAQNYINDPAVLEANKKLFELKL